MTTGNQYAGWMPLRIQLTAENRTVHLATEGTSVIAHMQSHSYRNLTNYKKKVLYEKVCVLEKERKKVPQAKRLFLLPFPTQNLKRFQTKSAKNIKVVSLFVSRTFIGFRKISLICMGKPLLKKESGS